MVSTSLESYGIREVPADKILELESQGFLSIEDPIKVWSPGGSYEAPRLVCLEKMPAGQTLPQAMLDARQSKYVQRLLRSGEWSRIIEWALANNSRLAESMATGPYERTPEILFYPQGGRSGSHAEGFLIQDPEIGGDGRLIAGGNGALRAKYVINMQLPLKGGYIREMPGIFDDLFDMIYGRINAKGKLPDNAHFSLWPGVEDLIEKESVMISLIRGSWRWDSLEDRLVDVIGYWGPLEQNDRIASRAAVDFNMD